MYGTEVRLDDLVVYELDLNFVSAGQSSFLVGNNIGICSQFVRVLFSGNIGGGLLVRSLEEGFK